MDTFLLVLLLIALITLAVTAYRLLSLGRGIGRFCGFLSDAGKGGFQRRIHLGYESKPLKRLGTELNALMDECQSAIEDKQQLELSHRQLTANISHDIRTPLTSLLGYVEVLRAREFNPEEQREYLDIVYAKACTMHRMTEDFFDLARMESDELRFGLMKVDLAETVRETLALFYQDFTRASVILEIRLPDGPVAVLGNRAAIQRVLNNLISNALKYGADGGALGVSMREEAGKVWVDVADQGRGIPQSELLHVFDRLYTAEGPGSTMERGAGLGLAIARQLVEKQGGEITAESGPGRTVFSFCLRKADA